MPRNSDQSLGSSPLVPDSAGGDPHDLTDASSLAAMGLGAGSILAAVVQFAMICGSPRLLFFHATDAAPVPGTFTRFDRLCFLVPALVAVLLGLAAMRIGKRAMLGIALATFAMTVVYRVGFSK